LRPINRQAKAQDTDNGVATSDAREPMPEGNSASSASQCEGVRVDEKITLFAGLELELVAGVV
jgi:hypothetical protein